MLHLDLPGFGPVSVSVRAAPPGAVRVTVELGVIGSRSTSITAAEALKFAHELQFAAAQPHHDADT